MVDIVSEFKTHGTSNSFKNSCFISYCRSEGDVLKVFLESLRKAIVDYASLYVDLEVYLDTDRLHGGQFFNEALAEALCRSLCMVVVYTPLYEKSPFCGREYAAMEILEGSRLAKIRPQIENDSLIVPIILRGEKDVPEKIRNSRQLYDFSKYTLLSPEIGKHPVYIDAILEISSTIHRLSRAFETLPEDPCADCAHFRIPSEDEVKPWREPPRVPPFPGRRRT